MSEYNIVLCHKCLRPYFCDPCPYCELAQLRAAVRVLGEECRAWQEWDFHHHRITHRQRAWETLQEAIEVRNANPIARAAVEQR